MEAEVLNRRRTSATYPALPTSTASLLNASDWGTTLRTDAARVAGRL
jgi:hypothetical protein